MSTNSEKVSIETEILEKLKNWKEIIAKYQVPDKKKALLQIITSFGPYVGLWVLMYFSMDWSIWITMALAVINSFFLVRIFIIQHDCGHQSFFKSKRLNNLTGTLCSVFSSLPYKYWAKVHNHHHGHTGQLEERDIGDIKFLTVNEYASKGWGGKLQYRIFRNPLVTFIISPIVYFTISNRFTMFFKDKPWSKVKRSQVMNNLLILIVYIGLGLLLGWKKFLFIQLVTIFIFSVIAFWFFYVQHQHEEGYQRWKKDWSFLVSAIRGSSYYKLPKIWQWLTGNIGIHHIHHLSSLVPNYNLEKCMKENPILSKYVTHLTFTESLATVKNKLWSEDLQKMVGWKEYRMLKQMGMA
ncbi:MAG: fatty acid desaturase [Saprospiraceae bacterium]|nr:fatty acid desaturase [Saprospiraceae bacterium]